MKYRIKCVRGRVQGIANPRAARPPPKIPDGIYRTPEFKRWRSQVFRRCGRVCRKCGTTEGRMYADHIVEVKDDPALAFDPMNGQVLCHAHHTEKTWGERIRRAKEPAVVPEGWPF